MTWLSPAPYIGVANVAWPLATAAVPITESPSRKTTEPLGNPAPGEDGKMVAVYTTHWPFTTIPYELTRVVVVVDCPTLCEMVAAGDGDDWESPLKVALIVWAPTARAEVT